MHRSLTVLLFATLPLTACVGSAPKAAAEAASRLLTAAQKNDRVAFEAEIDRAAVREDVRRQVTELAKAKSLDVEGGPSEFALDRMIGPRAVHLIGAGGGALSGPPTPDRVAPLMKALGDQRACLRGEPSGGECVLTFAKTKGDWRLVGMKATDIRIEIAEGEPLTP